MSGAEIELDGRENLDDTPDPRELENTEDLSQWIWAMDFDPDSGEHNAFLTDQNRIDLVPGSRKAACSGARIILNNSFAKLPIAGHAYATSQFIGRGPTEFSFKFESVGHQFLSNVQGMIEELEKNAREFRRIKGAARVNLTNNELLSLCGIEDGIISGFDTKTSQEGTNLYEGTLSFTSDGHHNENFRQEAYNDSSANREVAEGLLEYLNPRLVTRDLTPEPDFLDDLAREADELEATANQVVHDINFEDPNSLRESIHPIALPALFPSLVIAGVAAPGIRTFRESIRAIRMVQDLFGSDSGVEGFSEATTFQEVASSISETAAQIARELVVSFWNDEQATHSDTLAALRNGTLQTFPIVPDHNPRSFQYAYYEQVPLPADRNWLEPYVTQMRETFNRLMPHIPSHDFFVGEHRGAFRDYSGRISGSTQQQRQTGGHAAVFRLWPEIFSEEGESPTPFSQKIYGRRRAFRSVSALGQHLTDFMGQVYEVAEDLVHDHGSSEEFEQAFPGLSDRIVLSRLMTVHTTYPDLDLPPHPGTGLITDTEADYYFYNDGEEGLLNEVGPELAEEADERLRAMENSFTRLSSGNTYLETYLGRSRLGITPASDGTLTGSGTEAIEGIPGGLTIDPVQTTSRLLGAVDGQNQSIVDLVMDLSSQVHGGPQGSETRHQQIANRRREMFRNSTLGIPTSDNPSTMNVGPIDSALGSSDRSHSFSRNHLRNMIEQAVVQDADKTLTMRRAFPSFKIYFIEDDIGPQREHLLRRNATMYFDDLYNYNSVKSIRLIRSRKVPTDLLILQLTNVQGLLERRRWVAAPERQRELYQPGFEETELENPLKKLLMKEGLKVQARLGYRSDPNKMKIQFIGEVVEYSFTADSSDEVTIICQSYGSELVADLKGGSNANLNFTDTPDVCHTLMCSPELVHFGRFNLNPEFNPAEARTVATSRGESGGTGLITSWDQVVEAGQQFLAQRRSQWLLANNPADDNIYAPSVSDYISWWGRFQTALGNNLAWSTTILDTLAGAHRDESILTQYGRVLVNPGIGGGIRGMTGWGQRILGGGVLAIANHLSQTNYVMPSGTIWDVFKEMELRHPGWVAQPRPYGTRMTMFFGQPSQRYWADQITPDEMTVLRRVSQELDADWITSRAGMQSLRDQTSAFRRLAVAGRFAAGGTASIPIGGRLAGAAGEAAGAATTVAGTTALGMWALPPALRSATLELQRAIRDQRMISEVGEFLGRTFGRFRPFRRYHLITDSHHLLMNNIRASERGTFNTINLRYGSGEVYSLKADDSIPDEKVRVENASYPSCDNETLARRYCIGLLARHLKDTYKGEIVVTGKDIDPYDSIYLADGRSGMFGIAEVEQVVDTFTPETGWITEITPDMVVGVNEWATISTNQAISAIFGDLYRRYADTHGIGAFIIAGSLGAAASAGPVATGLAVGVPGYLAALGGLHIIRWTQDRQPLWISPLIFGDRPYFSGLDGFRQDGVFASLRGRLHAEINAFTDGWRAFHLAGYFNDYTIGLATTVAGQG